MAGGFTVRTSGTGKQRSRSCLKTSGRANMSLFFLNGGLENLRWSGGCWRRRGRKGWCRSILETNGDKTQRQLRTSIQTHKHIAYLFVGSKKHLIYDMFTNPNLPFYRSGKLFPST